MKGYTGRNDDTHFDRELEKYLEREDDYYDYEEYEDEEEEFDRGCNTSRVDKMVQNTSESHST